MVSLVKMVWPAPRWVREEGVGPFLQPSSNGLPLTPCLLLFLCREPLASEGPAASLDPREPTVTLAVPESLAFLELG